MCIRHCYLHISKRSYSRGSGTVWSWEGPIGSCSVTPGVWGQQPGKVGLPPGLWEQQDQSPPRGLLTPKVRWGGGGWTGVSGRGEVSGLEISLESSSGGRGKARGQQVGHSQHHAGDVFWKQLRAGRTGPQEFSFILSFLCKIWCPNLRHHQETSESSAVVASSKGLRPCPHPH